VMMYNTCWTQCRSDTDALFDSAAAARHADRLSQHKERDDDD
jgi:hypothetical protein